MPRLEGSGALILVILVYLMPPTPDYAHHACNSFHED